MKNKYYIILNLVPLVAFFFLVFMKEWETKSYHRNVSDVVLAIERCVLLLLFRVFLLILLCRSWKYRVNWSCIDFRICLVAEKIKTRKIEEYNVFQYFVTCWFGVLCLWLWLAFVFVIWINAWAYFFVIRILLVSLLSVW